MKITTYCRIDIKTGQTLEEESFEYAGPVALLVGNDSATGEGYSGSGLSDSGIGSGDPGTTPGDPGYEARMGISVGDVAGTFDGNEYGGIGADARGDILDAVKKAKATNTWSAIWSGVKTLLAGFVGSLPGFVKGTVATYGQLKDFRTDLTDQIKAQFPDAPADVIEGAVNEAMTGDPTNSGFADTPDGGGGGGENSGYIWTGSGFAQPGVDMGGYTYDSSGGMQFDSYEDALTYLTGQSAQQSAEAWEFYKEFVQPYTAEFYAQAQELIGPNMEYAKNFLEAENALLPTRTDATEMGLQELMANIERSGPVSERFYATAGNIDPDQRADEAQAGVQSAVKNVDGQMRRQAARVGMGGGYYADAFKTTGLDLARLISGARTQAKSVAEKENFAQLATAVNLSNAQTGNAPNALPMVSGDSSTGANLTGDSAQLANLFGNQAADAAAAGRTSELDAKKIEYNKPYRPSFGDMLINTALDGIANTGWEW